MADRHRPVRFISELPECCTHDRLRLPRPTDVVFDARGAFAQDSGWEVGLDQWSVSVGVSWDSGEMDLAQAVVDHAGADPGAFDVSKSLIDHGVRVDGDGYAWVGTQEVVVAKIAADLPAAAGRMLIRNGRDLLNAADALYGDLEAVVGPLVALDGTGDELWCDDVCDQWPEALITTSVILLRTVNVTPTLWGHRLGAWAAAQSAALFDDASSLVATKAAPLHRRDAIPDIDDDDRELTPAEQEVWAAEQRRLANHWRTHLGMTPLPDDPSILTWHTSCINTAIKSTISQWA